MRRGGTPKQPVGPEREWARSKSQALYVIIYIFIQQIPTQIHHIFDILIMIEHFTCYIHLWFELLVFAASLHGPYLRRRMQRLDMSAIYSFLPLS